MFRQSPASLIRKINCRVLSFFQRLRGLAYTQPTHPRYPRGGRRLLRSLSRAWLMHKERWTSQERRRSWGRLRLSQFMPEP